MTMHTGLPRRSAEGAKAGAHLDKSEFVDWLDGTLPAARQQHVQDCESCRITAEQLALAVRTAADDDVPEPSPLFWDQLSNRVQLAVANEPPPRAAYWHFLTMPRVHAAAAAAVIVILASVLVWRGDPLPSSTPTGVTATAAIDDVTSDEVLDGLENDEAWALVRAMAEDVAADDLNFEGVAGRLGSADNLALRLTDRERLELARLLEEYTSKPAKADSAS
jgi:hypothetical protein